MILNLSQHGNFDLRFESCCWEIENEMQTILRNLTMHIEHIVQETFYGDFSVGKQLKYLFSSFRHHICISLSWFDHEK